MTVYACIQYVNRMLWFIFVNDMLKHVLPNYNIAYIVS